MDQYESSSTHGFFVPAFPQGYVIEEVTGGDEERYQAARFVGVDAAHYVRPGYCSESLDEGIAASSIS